MRLDEVCRFLRPSSIQRDIHRFRSDKRIKRKCHDSVYDTLASEKKLIGVILGRPSSHSSDIQRLTAPFSSQIFKQLKILELHSTKIPSLNDFGLKAEWVHNFEINSCWTLLGICFLLIQVTTNLSPTSPYSTLIPLIGVLFVTMLKEIYEDQVRVSNTNSLRWFRSDQTITGTAAQLWRSSASNSVFGCFSCLSY